MCSAYIFALKSSHYRNTGQTTPKCAQELTILGYTVSAFSFHCYGAKKGVTCSNRDAIFDTRRIGPKSITNYQTSVVVTIAMNHYNYHTVLFMTNQIKIARP